MFIHFTHREKQVFFLLVIIFIAIFFVDQQIINDWELPFLILIVLPIGIYIVTDPERRKDIR